MFSKKIMRAWGLEKLTLDAQPELESVPQFSRPQKSIIFLENIGKLFSI